MTQNNQNSQNNQHNQQNEENDRNCATIGTVATSSAGSWSLGSSGGLVGSAQMRRNKLPEFVYARAALTCFAVALHQSSPFSPCGFSEIRLINRDPMH
ncbi:hypothetical protein PDM28_09875 [Stenotrophomonas aracearum]|jgi:hypothetical protein|uniref:Uncharacterized protein n=1 Tax=Stenotrophomonas aracearum TaxID=3003272 RepID=A0ABY9YIR5_9GAMM|nr:hypothetical protein [Stenotrophomonas sp. A5588]WNH50764.1 hypothetical protein PDM28_09875 [Stenotrophomonas sp. A5588]